MFEPVRVAIDDTFHALRFRVLPQAPVEIEPVGIRIQFDPRPGRRTRVDDGLLIDFVRFAFEEQPAGQVTEHVDVAVFRGANEALGVLRLVAGRHMEAGHHDLEFREQIIREIQALAQDVHLGAAQQPEVSAFGRQAGIEFFHLGQLLAQPHGIEAVGLKRRLRMIGDRPIFAAQLVGVRGDLLERVAPVAPRRVIVQRAAEVRPFEQAWDFPALRGGKLAVILAQFGRHVGQVQRLKNLLLRAARQPQRRIAGFFRRAKHPVFIEPQPAGNRALTHDDVVFFAPGEIRERERILFVRHDSQIGLDAARQDHAGLRITLGRHRDNARLACKKINHHSGSVRRGEEVDVAHHLLAPAQAPRRAATVHLRMIPQAL